MFYRMRTLGAIAALLCVAAQEISPQDVETILKRADALLEEAKTGYDDSRSKNSVQGFAEAGFKLEEARFKYLVVQEIGSADNKKAAGDRIRAVQQLGKLVREARLAISSPAASTSPAAPAPEKPAEPSLPKEPPSAVRQARRGIARPAARPGGGQAQGRREVRPRSVQGRIREEDSLGPAGARDGPARSGGEDQRRSGGLLGPLPGGAGRGRPGG